MAENLRVMHYRNGDSIPNVTDATAWGNLTAGGWSIYNHDLYSLEAPVKTLTAIDARVAYGVDGDEACLPTVDKVFAASSLCYRIPSSIGSPRTIIDCTGFRSGA